MSPTLAAAAGASVLDRAPVTLSLKVLSSGVESGDDPDPLSPTAPAAPPSVPFSLNGLSPEAIASADAIVISDGSRRFRARFFPDATDEQWSDWKWQLRSRVKDLATLERVFELTADEREAMLQMGGHLPVGITPYYASLIDRDDPADPLRKTMIPVGAEFIEGPGESKDPLNEDGDAHVEGVVHRYPDRVLFLVTQFCAVYCRYCTRARLVGQTGEYHFTKQQAEKGLRYIAEHPEIRDVLISGGDPLTMADDKLEWLLRSIREIPHIEFLRIGSKIPIVLPQRITSNLARILRRYRVWLSVHCMHPSEMTPEVAMAADRLADHGILMGSQTVLTKGVNDDVPTMKRLMHELLKARIRPYYIYQCDPISGSAHFRTPIETGLKIIEGLRGHTTGYAVPHFVVDAPGGGGKIPLVPDYFVGRDGDDVVLRNFEGSTYRYHDPLPTTSPTPKPAAEAAPCASA